MVGHLARMLSLLANLPREAEPRSVATKAGAMLVVTIDTAVIKMERRITTKLATAGKVTTTIHRQEVPSSLARRMPKTSGTTQDSTRFRMSRIRNQIDLSGNLINKRVDKANMENLLASKAATVVMVLRKRADMEALRPRMRTFRINHNSKTIRKMTMTLLRNSRMPISRN